MLIHPKVITALSTVTDKHDERYMLAGIKIEDSGELIATNGHALLHAASGSLTSPAEYPDEGAAVQVNANVPAAALLAAGKRVAKHGALCNVQVAPNGTPGASVVLTTCDAELATTTATIEHTDATFPAWRNVLEPVQTGAAPVLTVTIARGILESLVKASKAIGPVRDPAISFTFRGAVSGATNEYVHGIYVELNSAEGMPAVDGVIMPIRR